MSHEDTLEQNLASGRKEYRLSLQKELASLCYAIEELFQSSPFMDDEILADVWNDIYQRLRKMAEPADTFGFTSVGEEARHLASIVRRSLEGGGWPDTQAQATMLTKLYSLQAALTVAQQWTQAPLSVDQCDGPLPAAKIWLIEEDALLGRQISEQLANFGYEVRSFTSCTQACTAASSEIPDIIIVDAMLEFGHLAPCRALTCPRLFISDQDTFDARIKAAQHNAKGYFLKPLNIPQLVNRLEQLLQERHPPPARILVVDDGQQLADYYRRVLETSGMEVRVLENPRRIMEELSTFRPELLLMDVNMPNYKGPDLASVVRQYDEWSSLPIVFLSAETDLVKQVDALSHGADDFLTKPISAAQLVASVRVRIARSRTLSTLLNKDSLTGLLKHASIKSAAIDEINRAYRHHYPVTVAMVDLDHFKRVNDTYGHAVGDVVIASVATLLRQRLRKIDMIGRYGGEEFLVVLPHCTAENGWKRLEDIREYFSRLRFNHAGQEFACTLSAGMVCSIDVAEDARDRLLVLADEALYRAKRGGRNQVCQ
ncbi:diguanylate cyclase [Vreelandella olivaria]|uniref:diguanylate cyclase n=1 Tax=Vreelandella olivaria TaxID=390919 RepID=UPI00201F44C8|nr:diguanylate cyclase [Halomonas olivaria]